MQRYLALFEASSVPMFLADREFIGQEWFKFLKDNSIPFAIRVKVEQLIVVAGREYSLCSYLRRCKGERASQQLCQPRQASLLLICILGQSASRGVSC